MEVREFVLDLDRVGHIVIRTYVHMHIIMLAHTLYLSHFQESQYLPEAVGGAHVHPTQGTEGAAGVVHMYYVCASVCGGWWGVGGCGCGCVYAYVGMYVHMYVCTLCMYVIFSLALFTWP